MATFSTVAALTMSFHNDSGVADGQGRISTKVSNASDKYQKIHLYFRIRAGGSAPTAGKLVHFYFYREDNHATEYTSDGVTLTDAEITTKPKNAQHIGSAKFAGSANEYVYFDVVVKDPGPGEWAVAAWNESGATWSTTSGDSFAHWVGEKA